MNPFYYINEMRQNLEMQKQTVAGTPARISAESHYEQMINMLDILEIEMKEAEYHYQIKSVDNQIRTFDEMTVFQKELNDDVIIFQPIAIGEEELSAIDMQSLAEVLTKLRDNGTIKENMLLLPPNINVFKAVLANSDKNE